LSSGNTKQSALRACAEAMQQLPSRCLKRQPMGPCSRDKGRSARVPDHVPKNWNAPKRAMAKSHKSEITWRIFRRRFEPNGTAVLNRIPERNEFENRLSGWYWQIKVGDEIIARSRSLLLDELPAPRS
jgi:hypothetical protein